MILNLKYRKVYKNHIPKTTKSTIYRENSSEIERSAKNLSQGFVTGFKNPSDSFRSGTKHTPKPSVRISSLKNRMHCLSQPRRLPKGENISERKSLLKDAKHFKTPRPSKCVINLSFNNLESKSLQISRGGI